MSALAASLILFSYKTLKLFVTHHRLFSRTHVISEIPQPISHTCSTHHNNQGNSKNNPFQI